MGEELKSRKSEIKDGKVEKEVSLRFPMNKLGQTASFSRPMVLRPVHSIIEQMFMEHILCA